MFKLYKVDEASGRLYPSSGGVNDEAVSVLPQLQSLCRCFILPS